jgi:hypothetical protein
MADDLAQFGGDAVQHLALFFQPMPLIGSTSGCGLTITSINVASRAKASAFSSR